MNNIRIAVVTLLLFLPALPAQAIILGYVTGNDYLKLDDNARLGWLIGAMDGIMAESTLIKKDAQGPWLGRCIDGLDTQQIKAIFEKELSENPEGWHAPAALIFRGKMKDFCRGKI